MAAFLSLSFEIAPIHLAMADFKLHRLLPAFLSLFILLIPSVIAAGCQCLEEEEKGGVRNKTLALNYEIVAIASILLAGILGGVYSLTREGISSVESGQGYFLCR